MAKTICAFCGQSAARSREHIWPDWLLRHIELRKSTMAHTHFAIDGRILSRRVQSASSVVYGKVCAACNDGWMSQLEGSVKPIVSELISSQPSKGALLAEEAHTLAVWAFKTAIVRNAGTNYRTVIPEGHYRHLYQTKDIPPNVYVDMALCPSHAALAGLQSQTLMGFLRPEDAGLAIQVQQELYNVTLAIGPLLLRTIYFPLHGYTVATHESFIGGARRLHPFEGPCSLQFTQHCDHPVDFEAKAYFVAVESLRIEA